MTCRVLCMVKEQEQQRLDKIHALQKTDIQNALAEQSQTQRELEVTSKTKDEIVAENRERKLREKLAKLKAKQEHAKAVRQRRLQAAAAAAEAGDQQTYDDNATQ